MKFYRLLILSLVLFSLMFGSSLSAFAQAGPDRDGDGVIDDDDQCISEPGTPENNGCPEESSDRDPDGDGIANDQDQCPDVPGDAANNGCPPANNDTSPPQDGDGDGIPDSQDQCPSVPGDAANNGCPPADPAIVLDPMPSTGDCVASTISFSIVNIRTLPDINSGVVSTIEVNELFTVYAKVYTGDVQYPVWYWLGQGVPQGWAAESVLRFGGECIFSSNRLPDFTYELAPPITQSTISLALPPAPLGYDVLNGCTITSTEAGVFFEDCGDPDPAVPVNVGDFLAPGCELTTPEAGVYILVCEEETPTPVVPTVGDQILSPECELLNPEVGVYILDCTPDPVEPADPVVPIPSDSILSTACEIVSPEVGVYILVCGEDNPEPIVPTINETLIPQGCELDTPEAGVYILDCTPDPVEPTIPLGGEGILAPGCELISPEAGVFILDCGETTSPSIFQIGELKAPGCEIISPEAGVYIENCDEDDAPEIVYCTDLTPDNISDEDVCIKIDPNGNNLTCEIVSPEAGVYTLECEGLTQATVSAINPPLPYCDSLTPDTIANVDFCIEIDPEGNSQTCEIVSPEAGVYTLNCDNRDTSPLNPNIPLTELNITSLNIFELAEPERG